MSWTWAIRDPLLGEGEAAQRWTDQADTVAAAENTILSSYIAAINAFVAPCRLADAAEFAAA